MAAIDGISQRQYYPISRSDNRSSAAKQDPSPIDNHSRALTKRLAPVEYSAQAYEKISYDAPDRQHNQAIHAYLHVQYQSWRDEVTAMFGVDLYV